MTGAERRFPASLLLPAAGLAFLVWLVPLGYAAVLSLTNATPGQPGQFAGLVNYWRALHDASFARSLAASVVFAAGAATLQVGLGLALALAFRTAPRARVWLQVALLLPWALADVAAALIWHGFLAEQTGLINTLLRAIGLPALPWMTTVTGAMSALWLATLWHGLAFSTFWQMAGLASLPDNLLQAARLDGASRRQMWRAIVWPHQRPTLAANALLVGLGAMMTFSLPFALTGGGPLGATEFLALYTYRTALNGRFELGYASALGMIALAIYALFTASYLRWRKS